MLVAGGLILGYELPRQYKVLVEISQFSGIGVTWEAAVGSVALMGGLMLASYKRMKLESILLMVLALVINITYYHQVIGTWNWFTVAAVVMSFVPPFLIISSLNNSEYFNGVTESSLPITMIAGGIFPLICWAGE